MPENRSASEQSQEAVLGQTNSKTFSDQMEVDEQPLLVEKGFCNFCGDGLGENIKTCVDCGAYVCHQVRKDGSGCIMLGTVKAGVPFRCLLCDQKEWKSARGKGDGDRKGGLQYEFIGYGGRKRSKLNWPMLLATASLDLSGQSFLAESLALDFKNHYLFYPENLCLVCTTLRAGEGGASQECMQVGREFVLRSIASRVPANVFLLVEAKTDLLNSRLVWSIAKNSENAGSPQDLLGQFFGKSLLEAMHEAAASARSAEEESPSVWYKTSPIYRGGWRGLFLLAGGFPTRSTKTLEALNKLVEDDLFDIVVGFSSPSLRVEQAKDSISQLIERIGVDKTTDLWDTAMYCMGNDAVLLDATSVIVVFRDRGSGHVYCRKIARHFLPYRPWGAEFRACKKEGKKQSQLDFFVKGDANSVRMECKDCGWKSGWVKEEHRKDLLFRLNSKLPNVYWHSFPPSEALRNVFVNCAESVDVDRRNKSGGDKPVA